MRLNTLFDQIDSRTICTDTSAAVITVCIVEDNLTFQSALRETIDNTPDMQVLAVASSLKQGHKMLDSVPSDVLLVDLGLPEGSGIAIIRAAAERWPQCNIMVSTAFGDESNVMQSLEAGATGYLLKDDTTHSIVREIRNLHQGGSPISPLIARQLLMRFRQNSTAQRLPQKSPASLSAREQQVLNYITKGFTSNEIAVLMSVSCHTVRSFIRRVYTKLAVRSKTEAIYEATQQGLINP